MPPIYYAYQDAHDAEIKSRSAPFFLNLQYVVTVECLDEDTGVMEVNMVDGGVYYFSSSQWEDIWKTLVKQWM